MCKFLEKWPMYRKNHGFFQAHFKKTFNLPSRKMRNVYMMQLNMHVFRKMFKLCQMGKRQK